MKGDRVEIVALQDDPRAVPVGTQGVVTRSSRVQVLVDWDNGSDLALALPEDSRCVRKVA
jgi:hypothetical protein